MFRNLYFCFNSIHFFVKNPVVRNTYSLPGRGITGTSAHNPIINIINQSVSLMGLWIYVNQESVLHAVPYPLRRAYGGLYFVHILFQIPDRQRSQQKDNGNGSGPQKKHGEKRFCSTASDQGGGHAG